jgi:ketosteroid isomerase-like protein
MRMEPVEVVRAYVAALNARDVERMLELADEDVEFNTPRGTLRGHDALRRFMEQQSFGTAYVVVPRAFYERADLVVIDALNEMRYVDTGELAESFEDAPVFTVRDGRVARLDMRAALATALADAGMDDTNRVSVEP